MSPARRHIASPEMSVQVRRRHFYYCKNISAFCCAIFDGHRRVRRLLRKKPRPSRSIAYIDGSRFQEAHIRHRLARPVPRWTKKPARFSSDISHDANSISSTLSSTMTARQARSSFTVYFPSRPAFKSAKAFYGSPVTLRDIIRSYFQAPLWVGRAYHARTGRLKLAASSISSSFSLQ